MAQDMLSSRLEFGRTFISAMWVLGSMAAIQVVAVSWAVIRQGPRPATPVSLAENGGEKGKGIEVPPGAESNGKGTVNPAIDPNLPNNPNSNRNPAIPATTGVPIDPFSNIPGIPNGIPIPAPAANGNGTGSRPLGAALATAALERHPAHQIEDPLMEKLVATGEELRGTGNMGGALKALRDAEKELPDHPRVLAELAGTFSLMGMEEKAMGYWERIFQLGPVGAGAYYDLAQTALKGDSAAEGTTAAVLKIEDVSVRKLPITEESGENVVVTVKVSGNPEVRPSGEEMSMLVYFYDLANGKDVEPSTADTSERYPSEPYNWQGGSNEVVEVTYHQPVFTVEEKRELGTREYHGYVIELYYRDQLQHTVAEPKELLEMEEVELEAPRGPDGSLFPAGTVE
ncbi:MAG: hypothetical protein HKN23_20120 [Verrucomicrobiales bacterium]|nr:hypothetical protein [Verrucomicrobiales bacterium]